MDGPLEEAVLAKDDPEEDFIDADDTIDERSEEEILKEILNRGGVPSRPSHHIVRDNEIESLKQGLANLGLLYLSTYLGYCYHQILFQPNISCQCFYVYFLLEIVGE